MTQLCRPGSFWSSRPGVRTPRSWLRTLRGVGDGVRGRLELGGSFDEDTVAAAWRVQRAWRETLERVFAEVDLLVTPTLSIFPPHLEDGDDLLVSRCTLPVNLAGVPALSLPVPSEWFLAGQYAAGRAGAPVRTQFCNPAALLEAAVA